ncbi:metalloregulator ArsR/SmtB family transcription factor [Aquibacillus albus]|uniref:DNA-binding transcriptional ArsR family regulator n=1 Tax=Aquibacillus albus TaxID=1168171 RepID=A0ABS2N667_9BACI|nr:DNA-binding transcriptional ArsR family regulator [Aquibacillus albus]
MSRKDACDIYCYNEEKVEYIQGKLSNHDLAGVSKLFKVIGDERRTQILYALSLEKELCVCDIANSIGTSVATASHHLRTLHKQGIVDYRKEGKLAFYFLKEIQVKQLIHILLFPAEKENAHV